MVQIDGLGHDVLKEAIRRGDAPFFASLIQKHTYYLGKYFCGISSITTAVEAQLFYGKSDGVVGFSWFDRTLGRFVRGDQGAQMRAFEAHAFSRASGPLLKDGSCINSAWSGGATMANFSAEALAEKSPLQRLVKFRAMLIPLLNPIRFWAIVGIILGTLVMASARSIRDRSIRHLTDALTEALMRLFLCDVATSVAQVELLRQTPALFINFPMVDLASHKYGIRHPLVFSAIRLMDIYCKKIYESAKLSARDYHIVFLSDHGQSEAIPFEEVNGDTVAGLVKRGLGNAARTVCFTYGNDTPLKENMASNTLFIVPSSSIAHLYFSERLTRPATREDIEKSDPTLIATMLSHPGIGWILLRDGSDRQTMLGKKGEATFRGGNLQSQSGTLIREENRKHIMDSLAQLAHQQNNGDIVIFGAVTAEGKSVTFEPYLGTHGGFTGEMSEPFMLTNHPELIQDLTSHADAQTLFARIRLLRGEQHLRF